MNKTVERLMFMALGAVIALSAYFLGSINSTADSTTDSTADSTAYPKIATFDTVEITGHLAVHGAIMVGDPTTYPINGIHIQANEGGCSVLLMHNRINHLDRNDATMLLSTWTREDDGPAATILLQDIGGNKSVASSAQGWLKP